MLHLLHIVMVAIFVIWGVYFAYCLVRYRARDGQKAAYHHRGERSSLIPDGLILAFEMWLILAFGIPMWGAIKQAGTDQPNAFHVQLLAQQFAWNFQYPGPDGKFGRRDVNLVSASNPIGLDDKDVAAQDDWVSINNLRVPSGRPVVLQMTSKDVIHSFDVPNFRNKQDIVPGLITSYWFEPTMTGKFEIGCAQLCGIGHTQMAGNVFVDPPDAYDAWAKQQLEDRKQSLQTSDASAVDRAKNS